MRKDISRGPSLANPFLLSVYPSTLLGFITSDLPASFSASVGVPAGLTVSGVPVASTVSGVASLVPLAAGAAGTVASLLAPAMAVIAAPLAALTAALPAIPSA